VATLQTIQRVKRTPPALSYEALQLQEAREDHAQEIAVSCVRMERKVGKMQISQRVVRKDFPEADEVEDHEAD